VQKTISDDSLHLRNQVRNSIKSIFLPHPYTFVFSSKEINKLKKIQELFRGNHFYSIPCTVKTCSVYLGKREDLQAPVAHHVGINGCVELALLLSIPSWPIGERKL